MPMDLTDHELVVFLAGAGGGCSLDRSPKSNWVEKDGGLPNYICRIARAINRGKGHSVSSSIAIAVSRAKDWAAGGSKVTAATRAKAAGGVAEWEALKARAHAGHVVKATNAEGEQYLMLTNIPSFNTEIVQRAWSVRQQAAAEARRQAAKNASNEKDAQDLIEDAVMSDYAWIRELWTDFIIVRGSDADGAEQLYKVPYTVDDDSDDVTFAMPQPVTVQYVADTSSDTDDGEDLTDEEKELLGLDGSEVFLSGRRERDPLQVILDAYKARNPGSFL